MTTAVRCSIVMLQPTSQPVQSDGLLLEVPDALGSGTRAAVSAPTGQTSTAQADQRVVERLARRSVQTRASRRRGRRTPSSPVPAISCVNRMQRVHWMHRVMSATTCGPISVRSNVRVLALALVVARELLAVAEGVVLQPALAGLVADRAVERMVDEEELHVRRRGTGADLLGRRLDRQSVLRAASCRPPGSSGCPRSRRGTSGTGRRPRGAGGSRSGGSRCRRARAASIRFRFFGTSTGLPSKTTVNVSFCGGGGGAGAAPEPAGGEGFVLMVSVALHALTVASSAPRAARGPTRQRRARRAGGTRRGTSGRTRAGARSRRPRRRRSSCRSPSGCRCARGGRCPPSGPRRSRSASAPCRARASPRGTACTGRSTRGRRTSTGSAAASTMQVVLVHHDDRRRAEHGARLAATPSKSIGQSSISAGREDGRRGAARDDGLEPCRPSSMPPRVARQISSLEVTPIGSLVDARRVRRARRRSRASGRCSSRRADRLEPLGAALMMCGTQQSVSTLLTTVGAPKTPATAGNGGLIARLAALALEASRSAPSPRRRCRRPRRGGRTCRALKPEPRMFLPRKPFA